MKRRKRGKEESRRWLNTTKQSKGRWQKSPFLNSRIMNKEFLQKSFQSWDKKGWRAGNFLIPGIKFGSLS